MTIRASGGPLPSDAAELYDQITAAQEEIRVELLPTVDVRALQDDVDAWVERNFGHDNELATVGGLVEETGEVMRAVVKRSQGIRGTTEEWDAELRKEAADVFIKLCDVASFYGFDLANAINERWDVVKQRDWKADPTGHGIEGET
jgi:NTP pyrophosphatase (non-canonical NTP hydrolase)